MKKEFVILSHKIKEDTPLYGNTPNPKIERHTSIESGDSSNSVILKIHNHSGTHIDAPHHFNQKGKKISEYSIEELIFYNVIILNISKKEGEWIGGSDISEQKINSEIDCLLIKTGFEKFRDDEVYKTNNPGITPEAIEWIRTNLKNVKCLGIDTISITGFQDRGRGRVSHRTAFEEKEEFGQPLLLIEDMKLSCISNEKIKRMFVVPWGVEGIDSSPCTVISELVG